MRVPPKGRGIICLSQNAKSSPRDEGESNLVENRFLDRQDPQVCRTTVLRLGMQALSMVYSEGMEMKSKIRYPESEAEADDKYCWRVKDRTYPTHLAR